VVIGEFAVPGTESFRHKETVHRSIRLVFTYYYSRLLDPGGLGCNFAGQKKQPAWNCLQLNQMEREVTTREE
jgi:hypothetical protein